MYEAVLFDLDGTLTNTLRDIADAMNRALRLHGLPEFPVEEYRYLVGDGVKKLSERAVRGRADVQAAVLRDYQAYYGAHSLETSRPYEGIPELLEALAARGLKLCVLSNKPHADTCHVVSHFFPQIAFTVVQGQLEGVPVKPDPAGALTVARLAQAAPDSFLYLGDTAVDMTCARNAGMHPVGVTWGFRPAEELQAAGAELLIGHPLELLQQLKM